MLRKILDRVGFEQQVGTYPYEIDRSTPPGRLASSATKSLQQHCRIFIELKFLQHVQIFGQAAAGATTFDFWQNWL